MAKTIRVKGAGDDRRVVIWERSPLHPQGEAFVPNDGKTYTVGETAAVKRLIGEGRLVPVQTQVTPVSRQQTPPTQKRQPPWEGYDEATVEEVVERLRGMPAAEREQVIAYERSNKARKGIISPDVNWNS